MFQLQEKNKQLERKILLLGEEFRRIKVKYEKEIEKYKYLLSNSLLNLQ